MKWKKFTLNTTTEAVDLVSSMLDELGIEGIEVEDHVPLTESETKGMFIDILPDLGPDDGTAKVSFYLDDEKLEGLEELLRQIEEGLDDLSEFVDVGRGPSRSPRQRTRTGSTTGNSISSLSRWTTSSSSPPGRRFLRPIRTSC